MSLKVKSIKAKYGDTYKKGYIGFTYYNTSVVSKGIAYMTRWAKMSDIRVSHTLLVTGENECIEAHIKNGVERSDLKKYFNDPNCQIFFRKPVGLNAKIAKKLKKVAEAEIGDIYDKNLILCHGLQATFLGKLVNKIFKKKPDRLVSKILNRDDRWICSELVAYCLSEHKAYKNKGILRHPEETIDPQELFEDTVIFEPWKYKK